MRPPRGRRKRRWLFLASTKQDWASILVFLLTDDQPGTGADAHPDADEMSSSLPYPPSGRLSVCHRAPSMKTDKLLPLQRHKDAPSPGPPPSLAAGSMVRPSSVSPRDSSAALPPPHSADRPYSLVPINTRSKSSCLATQCRGLDLLAPFLSALEWLRC